MYLIRNKEEGKGVAIKSGRREEKREKRRERREKREEKREKRREREEKKEIERGTKTSQKI